MSYSDIYLEDGDEVLEKEFLVYGGLPYEENEINISDGNNLGIECSENQLSGSYCIIPMSLLQESPYSLSHNDPIEIKGRVKTTSGWTEYSEPEVGPDRLELIPTTSVNINEGEQPDHDTIRIEWIDQETYYDESDKCTFEVYWDRGLPESELISLGSTD